MTKTTTRAPGAPLPRTFPALDKSTFHVRLSEAVCQPSEDPIHALQRFLGMIEGVGGYLSCSAVSLASNREPLPAHLEAMGDVIEWAAKVAGVLADEVERTEVREGAA